MQTSRLMKCQYLSWPYPKQPYIIPVKAVQLSWCDSHWRVKCKCTKKPVDGAFYLKVQQGLEHVHEVSWFEPHCLRAKRYGIEVKPGVPVKVQPGADCDHDDGCDHPVAATENGKPEPKNEKSNISTQIKLTIREPNKDDGSEDDSDFDEDSDEDDSDGNDSDEGQIDLSGVESSDDNSDDDYDDESSDEADEETPKKGTKRPAQSASKTPIPEKKAKLLTPQKTGPEGKKVGGHTATPHPSKKSGKTSINNDNSKQKTPKSSGQIPCKSCSKTFNSDTALQSHSKAKHSEDK
ncbi:hypothetical protein IFM89_002077 [Coptis chinensis]|uniref:C2H2-type domain-containing protein n=1 Tax=Coptis chinensis TaxID=261450 RepID=A0A835H3L2_9MAGN|nr:hypothetical protein IFM89_002077 [Coptis chinensis]